MKLLIYALLFVFFELFIISTFTFVLLFSIVAIFDLLDGIGHEMIFVEALIFITIFMYLVAPYLGYTHYDIGTLAREYLKVYMKVPFQTYFDITIPLVFSFIVGLKCIKLKNESQYLADIINVFYRKKLFNNRIIIVFFIISIIIFPVRSYLPSYFNYIFTIVFFSSFSLYLYFYFSERKLFVHKIILILFPVMIALIAVQSGMFTIVAYIFVPYLGFLFLGKKISIYYKVGFIGIILILGMAVQYSKYEYRRLTWRNDFKSNKVLLFASIFKEKIIHLDEAINYDVLTPIYIRINQGVILSSVFDYIPKQKRYDNGSRLSIALFSSLVPRIFWQSKPENGGKFNMKYYANISLRQGVSMNVGPVGEAYGSWGKWGGSIYLFLFGFLISYCIRKVILLSTKYPFLLLWIPTIFYETGYCMENDSLQAINSLVKISFYLLLLRFMQPKLFSIK